MPHDRHDLPIFRAWRVMEPQRVPSYDVGIFDWAVGFGPDRQTIVTLTGGWINACRKTFINFVGRNPKLMSGKRADFLRAVIGIEKRSSGGTRHQFISGRITERAFHVRIDEMPHGGSVHADIHHGVLFGFGDRRLNHPDAFTGGIFQFAFHQFSNHETVVHAVHIHIQSEIEEMLVVSPHHICGDRLPVQVLVRSGRRALFHGFGL